MVILHSKAKLFYTIPELPIYITSLTREHFDEIAVFSIHIHINDPNYLDFNRITMQERKPNSNPRGAFGHHKLC